MGYELNFKGSRIQIKLQGEDANPKELKLLIESIHKLEKQVSEIKLREKVVKQLKQEILQDVDGEEMLINYWELPQDFLKSKDATKFISMEADLNNSLHYEKIPFSLTMVVDENGQSYAFDRNILAESIRKVDLHDHVKKANSALVRLKANVSKETREEIEDFVSKTISLDRIKFTYEKKKYENRASVEIVFFGDFPE